MFENLTGSWSENTNLFNYKKIIKSNLYYSLFNRKDQNNSILNWGESVLIKVDNNTFAYDDNLLIFNYSTSFRFKVLKVLGNWLLVNMMDSTNNINYVKFSNDLATKDYFVSNMIDKRPILESFATNTYNYLNVEMRTLDSYSTYPNFGNMFLKIDNTGGVVCYNMNYNFLINFSKNKFESYSFDLCHKSTDYIPIIRNLKFKELKNDSLIFEYITNNNKQSVVFTTKNYEINYNIYPDTFYNINQFVSLSNDYKVHQQYANYMNDLDLNSSLQPNTIVNIPSNQIFYTKEYFGGETITRFLYGDKTLTTAQTLVNNTNIVYANNSIIRSIYKINDKIKIGSTVYTITNLVFNDISNLATITISANIPTTGTYNIVLNDYTKSSVILNNVDYYQYNNSNQFVVDNIEMTNGVANITTSLDLTNYFISNDKIYIQSVSTKAIVEYTVQTITTSTITLTSNYTGISEQVNILATYYKPFSSIDLIFKTFNGRLYGYTSTESIAKMFGLTNLLVTFSNSTNIEFRQLALFYGNSSDVPIYLSENRLITIPNGQTMNFAIVL